MQHLDTDRLAALADEAPTATEAAHLATCRACREEQRAYVALLDLARQEGSSHVGATSASLSSWEALAPALRTEGLMRSTADHAIPVAAPRRSWLTGWRRAAASIALLAGGAAIGRASATLAPSSAEPGATPSPAAQQVAVTPSGTVAGAPAATSTPAPTATLGISDTIPVSGEPPRARLASQGGSFAGIGEAMAALSRAQQDYQQAAAFLAEHDTTAAAGTPQILRARLAALDEVMPAVRAALYEAPQDPVLNQYYLTTADVRESTLRQLGRALPVGVRLNGY